MSAGARYFLEQKKEPTILTESFCDWEWTLAPVEIQGKESLWGYDHSSGVGVGSLQWWWNVTSLGLGILNGQKNKYLLNKEADWSFSCMTMCLLTRRNHGAVMGSSSTPSSFRLSLAVITIMESTTPSYHR